MNIKAFWQLVRPLNLLVMNVLSQGNNHSCNKQLSTAEFPASGLGMLIKKPVSTGEIALTNALLDHHSSPHTQVSQGRA